MGDDEWTVVAKGSRRKMSSTAFRALQVRAEHESGPAEDPPDASVDKTWSQIERAVREIRDAPFAKTLLRRMEDAGFVPNHSRAKPTREGLPTQTAHAHATHTRGTRNRPSGHRDGAKQPATGFLRYSRMVILGLGSPTRSAVSRFQLALALVLAQHLRIDAEDVDLYDPVFTRVDAETMRAKKVGTVLDRAAADLACGPDAAPARAPTFWYMPHCEVALYENVLRANGGGDDVMGGGDDSGGGDGGDAAARQKKKRAPLVFLGNRFETYELRWVGRRGAPECPTRVLEAAVAIAREGVEIEVDPEGTFTAAATLGAFNDTSVQAWGF
jgi:hypothetical protein